MLDIGPGLAFNYVGFRLLCGRTGEELHKTGTAPRDLWAHDPSHRRSRMLRKIRALSLSLMCLIAVSTLGVAAAVSADEGAPTIGELEQFAEMAGEAAPSSVDADIAKAQDALDDGKPSLAEAILDNVVAADLTGMQKVRVAELIRETERQLKARRRKKPKGAGEVPAEMLTEAEKRTPTSGRVLRSLATLHLAAGRTQHAGRYYTRLVELFPDAEDIDELRNMQRVLGRKKGGAR